MQTAHMFHGAVPRKLVYHDVCVLLVCGNNLKEAELCFGCYLKRTTAFMKNVVLFFFHIIRDYVFESFLLINLYICQSGNQRACLIIMVS